MGGFVRGVLIGLVLIGAGWLGGSIYPAPASVTAPIAGRAVSIVDRLGIDEATFQNLSHYLSEDDLQRLRHDATALAAQAGEVIIVEHDTDLLAEQIAALPAQQAAVAAAAPATTETSHAFEAALTTCPGMTVSNAPATDAQRRVSNYASRVNVNGVVLAANPTTGACLSSGFGPRGRGQHRGVDYHAATGGPILAAAGGTVVEAKYRDDFGNMLLIDHGQGVYTRYAHLSSFSSGIVPGATVEAGQQIGLMGNTASYAIPIHLHYEVLTGDYSNPRASFGLTPNSPFTFPSAG